jgi:8-oxo-dGTP diphosphatase
MSYTYKHPRPALTIDCAVFRKGKTDLELLLIQRDRYPFEGVWALPGGFVEMKERLHEAASRELEEETGLKGIQLMPFKTFDTIDRDPRGRTISFVFYGLLESPAKLVKAASDARDAQWFNVKQLPELAFDHAEIVGELLKEKGVMNYE